MEIHAVECITLPELNAIEDKNLLDLRIKKDIGAYKRIKTREMKDRHPHIEPNSRSILLGKVS